VGNSFGLIARIEYRDFSILMRVIIFRIEVTVLYALDLISIIARCPSLQSCGMELLD
jgi:hypothetical protein